MAKIDFNTADLSSLIERIETITDPRDPRGVRHSFASTLVLIACATLAGHKSLVALSEWCDSSSQEVLSRLGARISPSSGLRIPPSTRRSAGQRWRWTPRSSTSSSTPGRQNRQTADRRPLCVRRCRLRDRRRIYRHGRHRQPGRG